MPSTYMSHTMADLTTTHLSSSFTPPSLIPLQPQVAFKSITHFMPSQKCCNGSFSRHFQLQRTFAKPREHSKIVSVDFVGRGLATGFSHLHYEEDNSMQPGGSGDEDNEETPSTSNAETSLVLATPDDDKEASLAGLSVLEAPIYTTDTLQTGGTDKLSSDDIEAQKERRMRKKTQQLTYLFAAVASSVGITSLAGASVYCRFAWQMQGGEVPWTEMCGTLSLALGAAVGMEYWARWAHRVLWHASLWSMHESHHQPRDGPFELNDVFAIINAIPAIALMAFGFLNKGLVPGLCFGAGLGITMFGIAYMFVHDGLVHRRFPVGPIAGVPYFQKVAAAHQLHHADKFNGVPYGLFLGPMELEEVGGRTELEKLFQKRKRESKNPINS